MATTKEVLVKARELVAKGWTQGNSARDARGAVVDALGEDACSFCMVGAIWAAEGTKDELVGAREALEQMVGDEFHNHVPFFNDAKGRTKEEVLDIFDRAIAACKEP